MNKATAPLFLALISILPSTSNAEARENGYEKTIFVANKEKYKPVFATEKEFINAWGIAIRPKGAGGHFWITAKDISYEYVGDVTASEDKNLRPLHQDKLKIVKLPVGGNEQFATSTVFNDSKENFIITQEIKGAQPITAPAKFLFASDGGIISAWTERKLPDGNFDRSEEALTVIDESKKGAQFFGLAISHNYNRLYAANFGKDAGIEVFDGKFQPVDIKFDMPFDSNKNGKVDAGEYAPFNVQALTTPEGESRIFVTYAKTQTCPKEEVARKTCDKGGIFAGEEDTSKAGQGRLAEFSEDGKLAAIWNDGGNLSAPWGLAYAPDNFGALSGNLLVANFGSGTIAAFDAKTRSFTDVIKDKKGKPLKIEKIWGLLFGNGESLGDADSLYFTAGPDDEKDGIFGKLRVSK